MLPALRRGEGVILDFAGVELATQSFIHALISEPIRQFGEEIIRKMEFRNAGEEVRALVLTVVEYTLLALESAEDASPDESEPGDRASS